MFDSVKNSARGKEWRNSFAYIMSVLLRNHNIDKIDIITSLEVQQLRDLVNGGGRLLFAEVVEDCLLRYATMPNNAVAVSFHFVSGGRSFHDRFIANGRFCFAIGHGLDVCKAGFAYDDLIKRANRGEHIFDLQWRNMQQREGWQFSDFNVFYGCSKVDVPSGICVFEDENVDSKGFSRMYPESSVARRFSEIFDRFDWGRYQVQVDNQNQFAVNIKDNVTVKINQRASSDF
jgi:hypothetical protein